MGFPFLGARLFPAQSLFPASQGRNRRCCSEWKVGGVKHGHFPSEPPLVAVSLGCFRQGPCGLAPGTLLAKVGGVRDEPCVFPSPVAEEGTHPLFGLWVTFHPAGQGHPRDPSVTLLLTTARGSGAAELSLLASRETRGQGQDFFSLVPGLCCAIPTAAPARLGCPRHPGAVLCPRPGACPAGRGEDREQRGSGRCWNKPRGCFTPPAWGSHVLLLGGVSLL